MTKNKVVPSKKVLKKLKVNKSTLRGDEHINICLVLHILYLI